MGQLNMHLTQDFEQMLRHLMRLRQLRTKSEAIRIAVKESLEHSKEAALKTTDYVSWVGAAKKAPLNTRPKFSTDDALWS
jgi:hypothetical protein